MKIFIATGGTGGHVFPALAVANAMAAAGHKITISRDGRVAQMVSDGAPARAHIVHIWASGVGAKSRLQQAWSLCKIGVSAVALSLRFIFARPARVVAFGGYASVPAILAAHIWHIPTFLHEQNAAIGRANKFALRWVGTLMTSFPVVAGIGKDNTANLNVVYTGLPVRNDFMNVSVGTLDRASMRLLITGGSLGAQILDDVVPVAIAALPANIRKKLFVTHQTRPADVAKLQGFYTSAGIRANVLSFIHDMAAQMAAAAVVVSRAGASTVVELQTIGVPAILVPLNINPDQAANAAAFVKKGGGFNVPQNKFTAKWLTATLSDLLSNPARLSKMAAAARVPNNAVENIVKLITDNS